MLVSQRLRTFPSSYFPLTDSVFPRGSLLTTQKLKIRKGRGKERRDGNNKTYLQQSLPYIFPLCPTDGVTQKGNCSISDYVRFMTPPQP